MAPERHAGVRIEFTQILLPCGSRQPRVEVAFTLPI
jgi:hypothetical protein